MSTRHQAVWAAGLLAAGLVAIPASPAAATPGEAPVTVAADPGAAVRAAKKQNKRVEALNERTEYSQVFAEPTGRLTYEASATPQRVRKSKNSWADVDVNLKRGADGGLRPGATLADVRFSPGGKGPLATMVRDGKKMTLTWPLGVLPAPVVSGDSATYPGVLPDVDLVARATATGFTHVLVVKTAQAAANPKIKEITFDLGGDAKTQRLPDGTLRAVAGNTVVASADVPQMWDTAPGSGHAGPGDRAKVSKLGAAINRKGDLVLKPDANLLGASAKFPVYIDPAWSTGKSRWAYATNNNSNNSDTSVARVGVDPDGRTYRSFFEFPLTALSGKYVRSAYVQMVVDHTWSCTKTPNSMWQAGSITTPRTAWSTSLVKYLSSVSSNANEGSGCSDSPQPDMTVNFTGTAVGTLVNTLAGKGSPSVTFGFSAKDSDGSSESDGTRWKKYLPNKAKLILDYDSKPAKPTYPQVNGIACTTAGVRIGIDTPNFSAIMPDADGTTQTLSTTWALYTAPAGGTLTPVTSGVPGTTSVTPNTRGTSAKVSVKLTTGIRYAWRVTTKDPYDLSSPASDLCYFTVDTTVPDITVTQVGEATGPGKPVTFTIASTATDVTAFKYGWTEAATSTAAPVNKQATVTLTAPKYGILVLYAQAVDSTGNKGYGNSPAVIVPRPSPAIARWSLETYPGHDETAAATDEQPALAGDNQLTLSGVTWGDNGRVVGAKELGFTAASTVTTPALLDTTKSYSVGTWVKPDAVSAKQTILSQDGENVANFQLQADGTSYCFGVRGTDTAATTAYTAACASGVAVAGRWTHVAGSYDATAKTLAIWVDGALKQQVAAPAAWASSKPFRIGGRKNTASGWVEPLTGSVVDVQVFDRVLVGDDFNGKAATDEDSGGVDEPGILAPVRVGAWNFQTAVPCYEPTTDESLCSAPDAGSGWGQRLTLTPGTFVGGGADGEGLQLDGSHFADDPSDPHYGETTREYGINQRNVAGQWQDSPALRTDQSFTVSAWLAPSRLAESMTAVGQNGVQQSGFALGIRKYTVNGIVQFRWAMTMKSADSADGANVVEATSISRPVTADDIEFWTHLVGVFDAQSQQIRLYVNGTLQDPVVDRTGSWNAAGPLTVGAAWSNGYTDLWQGGIDDIEIFQGAMTGGQVGILHPGDESRPVVIDDDVQTIYMSPTGSDTASGDKASNPVRTLERVEQLVAAGPVDQNVEVRIHAGTTPYVSPPTTWETYRPGRTISFMPDDYEYGEGVTGIAALPVFQNARSSSGRYLGGYWFYACPGGALANGGMSGLRFYYLQVQNYANGGISLDGSAGPCGGSYSPSSGPGQPSARGLDGNTVFGMVFQSLGNTYTGGTCTNTDWLRCGYGGVVLTESSDNRIANNHFVNLRNTESRYIHAVYITHKSSHNAFTGNKVTGVSNDPVKVRDSSDFNSFDSNVFVANDFLRSSTPPAVHYLEEVDTAAAECSSYHNRFTNNDLGTYLTGSTADLPVWYLSPAGATNPGAAGCPALPTGETRLTTAGNTY